MVGKMHNRKIFFCSWRWSRQTRSLMPCQLRIRKWSLKLVSEPDPGASLLAEIAKFVHVIMVKRSLSFYFVLFFQCNKFHLHVHCFWYFKIKKTSKFCCSFISVSMDTIGDKIQDVALPQVIKCFKNNFEVNSSLVYK